MAARYPTFPGAIVALDSPIWPPEVQAWLRGLRRGEEPFPLSPSLLENILSWDAPRALAACLLPALCIAADTPMANLPRLAELCPRLSAVKIEGVGHFLPLEAPERVDALIDSFLLTCAGAGTALS